MMWWVTEADGQNWWLLHMASVALFWVAILLLLGIIALRPRANSQAADAVDTNMGGILSARTLLEERYTKGEIGREEFLNKMRDLEVADFRADPGAQAEEIS
jgi:uncharacterized membrane protein